MAVQVPINSVAGYTAGNHKFTIALSAAVNASISDTQATSSTPDPEFLALQVLRLIFRILIPEIWKRKHEALGPTPHRHADFDDKVGHHPCPLLAKTSCPRMSTRQPKP